MTQSQSGPQLIRPGQQGQVQPKARIMMYAADQQLCTRLLDAGYPQEVVLDIAEALAEKLVILQETEVHRRQNADLLKANQTLLSRAETAEAELKQVRKQLQQRSEGEQVQE